MIKRTICEYDIKHTGDEMDRLDILYCLQQLKSLCECAIHADVTISSDKSDLISVRIEVVDAT